MSTSPAIDSTPAACAPPPPPPPSVPHLRWRAPPRPLRNGVHIKFTNGGLRGQSSEGEGSEGRVTSPCRRCPAQQDATGNGWRTAKPQCSCVRLPCTCTNTQHSPIHARIDAAAHPVRMQPQGSASATGFEGSAAHLLEHASEAEGHSRVDVQVHDTNAVFDVRRHPLRHMMTIFLLQGLLFVWLVLARFCVAAGSTTSAAGCGEGKAAVSEGGLLRLPVSPGRLLQRVRRRGRRGRCFGRNFRRHDRPLPRQGVGKPT